MGTRQAVAAGLAATCALLLAGCSDDQPPPPAPTITSASATPSPSSDPIKVEVLSTYRAYWKARVQALAEPTKSLPKALTRYGSGAAVSDMNAAVLLFRQQGIELRGEPVLSPDVTEIAAQKASIVDCVDSTNWKPVYAATGKSALAPDQAARTVMSASLTKTGDTWQVVTATVERDRTC